MAKLSPEALEARRHYQRERRKRYFEQHPEAKEKQLEAQRRWREKNKVHCAEYMRTWRAAHPEKQKEYESAFWERKAAEMNAREV